MSEMVDRVAKAAKEVAQSMGSYFDDFVAAEIARAAIEAMREPTKAMLFVGANDEAGFTQRNLHQSWHLMIDEALADPRAIAAHKGE